MSCLFVLDVPENATVVTVAGEDHNVSIDKCGPYFRITSAGDIEIDRRSTGVRHAVWYSCVAGLTDSRITQWDTDALCVRAR